MSEINEPSDANPSQGVTRPLPLIPGLGQPTAGPAYAGPGYAGPGYAGSQGGYGPATGHRSGAATPPPPQGGGAGGWDPWDTPQGGYWAPQPPPRRRRPVLVRSITALIVIAAVAAGIGIGRASSGSPAKQPTAANPQLTPGPASPSAGSSASAAPSSGASSGASGSVPSGSSGSGGSNGTADKAAIAAKVDPGLVDVNTTLGFQGAEAAGTGIVLTSSGEVLTNNHVINGATSISVTDIGNGRTYKATVVGYDRTIDIAVLRLQNASGLHTVSLGNSSNVSVGNTVVAIGNAGGVGGTPSVASGSVTALDQSITASDESDGSSEQLSGLIQVDAGIQPGDSGGPLVNGSGAVIGIDTAASDGTTFQSDGGEGFAIPIDTAISTGNLILDGTASSTVHIGATGMLGVDVASPNSSGNNGFGGGNGSSTSGAEVAGVVQGTPAAQAGLAQGDVIVSLNGQTVSSGTALTSLLGQYHPGDSVRLGWQDSSGQSHSASVQLASGPAA